MTIATSADKAPPTMFYKVFLHTDLHSIPEKPLIHLWKGVLHKRRLVLPFPLATAAIDRDGAASQADGEHYGKSYF